MIGKPALLLGVLLAIGTAEAQSTDTPPADTAAATPPASHGTNPHHRFQPQALLRGVTFTEGQKAQLHVLYRDSHRKIAPLDQQLDDLDRQMYDQFVGATTLDPAKLKTLQQQASQIEGEIDAARLDLALQVRQMMTPEQIQSLAQKAPQPNPPPR